MITIKEPPTKSALRLAKTRDEQSAVSSITKATFPVRALYIGEHIDLRGFVQAKRVPAQQPAIVAIPDGGIAMLYRYGAVVFFDVLLEQQQQFLEDLDPLVTHSYERPETEELRISITNQKPEGEIGETVILKDASLERLQTVAAVLSKSVALRSTKRMWPRTSSASSRLPFNLNSQDGADKTCGSYFDTLVGHCSTN